MNEVRWIFEGRYGRRWGEEKSQCPPGAKPYIPAPEWLPIDEHDGNGPPVLIGMFAGTVLARVALWHPAWRVPDGYTHFLNLKIPPLPGGNAS